MADRPQHTVTTYATTPNLREAIAWYTEVLGAEQVGDLHEMDDGRIGHAEIRFGDTLVMMAEEFPEIGVVGPDRQRGSVFSFVFSTPEPDKVYQRAIDAGAEVDRPLADGGHGRSGWLYDPFGHRWGISEP